MKTDGQFQKITSNQNENNSVFPSSDVTLSVILKFNGRYIAQAHLLKEEERNKIIYSC